MAEQSLADVLPDFFATGRIALLVLAVMLVEGVVLLALARRSGAVRLFPIAANLASGACLVLALRAALIGAPWTMTALWLGLSFAAHAADLISRLRPAGPSRNAPSPSSLSPVAPASGPGRR
jgi:hypothetical protein